MFELRWFIPEPEGYEIGYYTISLWYTSEEIRQMYSGHSHHGCIPLGITTNNKLKITGSACTKHLGKDKGVIPTGDDYVTS
jgi:hypothetical protein